MKETIKQRNFKSEVFSLLFIVISSILMLIENIAVSENETLSLALYITAFLFAVFCLAVRAVNKSLDKNLSADLVVCVCSFAAFLLGFYQTGILSAMIFEYVNIISINLSSFIYKNSKMRYIRVFERAKQRVKLSDIEIGDRILVNEGEVLPFKCKDTVSGKMMNSGEIVTQSTVVEVYSQSNIYRDYEPDFQNTDKIGKISLIAVAGIFAVSTIICVVLGVLGGTMETTVYNILTVLVCLPFELTFLRLKSKKANIIYLTVGTVITAILIVLSILGVFPLWIAVIIRCVITFSLKNSMNFIKL